MLLNEVQKQQSTISRQQAEIQDLAARLAKLEALVAPVR
jgi:cell division protein FtsB